MAPSEPLSFAGGLHATTWKGANKTGALIERKRILLNPCSAPAPSGWQRRRPLRAKASRHPHSGYQQSAAAQGASECECRVESSWANCLT